MSQHKFLKTYIWYFAPLGWMKGSPCPVHLILMWSMLSPCPSIAYFYGVQLVWSLILCVHFIAYSVVVPLVANNLARVQACSKRKGIFHARAAPCVVTNAFNNSFQVLPKVFLKDISFTFWKTCLKLWHSMEAHQICHKWLFLTGHSVGWDLEGGNIYPSRGLTGGR